jgi:Zn-finger nucleic acid-binding protein
MSDNDRIPVTPPTPTLCPICQLELNFYEAGYSLIAECPTCDWSAATTNSRLLERPVGQNPQLPDK